MHLKRVREGLNAPRRMANWRLLGVHVAALSDGDSDAGGVKTSPNEAIAARIAAAKKYKEMGSLPAGGNKPVVPATPAEDTSGTSPLPPSPSGKAPSRGPADYSAMTEFLQSPVPSRSGPAVRAAAPPLSPPTALPAPGGKQVFISRIAADQQSESQKEGPRADWESSPSTSSGQSQANRAPQPSPAPPSAAVPFLQRVPNPSLSSQDLANMILNATQVIRGGLRPVPSLPPVGDLSLSF